jgi:hypothetical protein
LDRSRFPKFEASVQQQDGDVCLDARVCGRTLAVVRVQCLRPDDKPFAVATVSYQRPA